MGNQNKYKSGSIFDMQFITSSISTTLVLLLLGLVVFFVLTAHNLSVYVRENISFSVLISDDMKEADTACLGGSAYFYLFCPDKQYHKTGYLLQTLPHSHHEVGRSELGIHPGAIPSKECMERDIGSHRCRFHIDGDRLLCRDVRTGIASGHHA